MEMRKHYVSRYHHDRGNRWNHRLLSVIGLLLGLFLASTAAQQQQPEEHRIQRRFMWQQMDNSVMGGLMGRVFKGARAMKSMLTDLLPSRPSPTKNLLEFMPTQTTRVTYIIRNPQTHKAMRIIKKRGQPKKIATMVKQQPVETESSKLSYEMRIQQLEREQELIAEGKLPHISDEEMMEKYFKQKIKTPPPVSTISLHNNNNNNNANEVVTGKILEYQTWKPLYKPGEQPRVYAPLKPQALSQLHTDIHGHQHELLPKPEKLVSIADNHDGDDEQDQEDQGAEQEENEGVGEREENEIVNHHYEVTEHTGEASDELHSVASMESGFVPSRAMYSRDRGRTPSTTTTTRTRTTTSAASATTTTEPPNYPAAYLKKKNREAQQAKREKEQKLKELVIMHTDETWKQTPPALAPSSSGNVSYSLSSLRARLQDHQRRERHRQRQQVRDEEMEAALIEAMHGDDDKWPAEVQHSYVTIGPSAVAFDLQSAAAGEQESPAAFKPRSQYKRQPPNQRHRGTVKFGDKLNYDEV